MNNLNRHCIVAAKILADYNNNSSASSEYFTIEALEDGLQAKLSVNACEYSLDGNTWNSLSAATNTPSVNTGDKIYFRGDLTPASSVGIGTFTISKKCNVKGNIMSLLFGDNFEGQTDLSGYDYAFYNLFNRCSTIIDASQLTLPATTLADRCYGEMFSYCTSLVSAPSILPSTTLADRCYYYMFSHCNSLVSAPSLPATTLADSCYWNMFQNCTSLVTAPALPATTLSDSCYSYMFSYCTSLVTAPALPATTLDNSCYKNMFWHCTSLVTAPELPATTLAQSCYDEMFNYCSSLVSAPELPATILKWYCYNLMFYNCTKLNYIKALFTTTPGSSYTQSWTYGVPKTGTFVKNASATWDVTGVNGIPTGWTVVNDGEVITFKMVKETKILEYQAEAGMTWEEWVNSEYNTTKSLGGFEVIIENNIVTYAYREIDFFIKPGTSDEPVYSTDIIIPDIKYSYFGGFGGN